MVNPVFDTKRDAKGRYLKGSTSTFKGHKHREESKKLMSMKKKGVQTTGTLGKKRPDHVLKALKPFQYTKEGITGEKNPFYNKTHTKKTKNIIRQKAIIRWQNPDYRNNLINKFNTNGIQGKNTKGIKHTPEHIQNWRESYKKTPRMFRNTKPERMMQIALSLEGIKYEKHKILKFTGGFHEVDIFIEPNIVVEIDGIHWHLTKKQLIRDLHVTSGLTISGYHIIRITDRDIIKNTRNAAINVIRLIKDCQNKFQLKVNT